MVTPTTNSNLGIETVSDDFDQNWRNLVAHLSTLPINDPSVMAFTLTLRRIRKRFAPSQLPSTCIEPLCASCVSELVNTFPGTKQELLALYRQHLDEVNQTLHTMPKQRGKPNSISAA